MKNNLIITLLFTGLILFSSCKKYLDAKPDTKLVTPQTLKDIQGILDDADKMNVKNTPSQGESVADDFFILPASFPLLPLTNRQIYLWEPYDVRYPNDWNLAYHAIYNSNLSLELLEKVDRTTTNAANWDNVKGSALFYRSFHFLNLVSQYSKGFDERTAETDLGIVLRTYSDFNIPSKRSSIKDTYARIIDDLQTSLFLLPNYPISKLRPSKGAAYALLARTYLFMHEYVKAKEFASEALKLNAELMDYNGDPFINPSSISIPIRKLNSETIFYAEQGSFIVNHGITRSRIDTSLVSRYASADLRKSIFFNMIAGYAQFKGNYTGGSNVFFSGLATDELYLIRAECYAFLNELTSAMDDLNTLLKKRWNKSSAFVSLSALDREDALRKVRLERRKELLMRGLRLIDLKRYNVEGANITIFRNINGKLYSLAPNSPQYTLPIPVDVIEQSGMQQN